MDDIVGDFLVESREGLDQLDRDLVALESAPTDRNLLASVFRCVHTIKGTSGFFGFDKLQAVNHVGEGLLVRLRDGDLLLSREITSALLALVDAVRGLLDNIERTGAEGDGDYTALIDRLDRLQHGESPAAPAAEAPAERAPRVSREVSDEVHEVAGEARGASPAETSIRVDVGLLDKLMTLVGELVLARNQIMQHNTAQHGNAAWQRLNLLTTELQEAVMKTRMQPIGNVWSRFPRVVRDLAVSCGKEIRLEMHGEETELDKTLIEAIKDPLTHIVRNSADHGIERPEARALAGKPAEGSLVLRAYHEGGQVNIEISDDGGGIDPERLKQKAVEKGLITSEQALRLNEREALNLIFLPGFSTAQAVTNISGRGVGMDVVRTNIEKIGGAVDLSSVVGQGTTIKIRIPLTLAIIPALIVTCAGNRYAIPQVNLVELVRRETRRDAGIEMMHNAPVCRLRGTLLPLVHLGEALGHGTNMQHALQADALNIVVLQAGDRTFGLVVDQVNDTEEIVVKPLGRQLKGITAFAGATIMGDGRVALILDVPGIAQRAHVISETRDSARVDQKHSITGQRDNRHMLLVCAVGSGRRVAIPLSSVARLEEFPVTSLESAGAYDVVQYRGQILPLVHISDVIGTGRSEVGATCPVVVYSEGGRAVGLQVGRVLDIIEDTLSLDRSTARDGVLGSAVIQQCVTEVLDVSAAVRSMAPWLASEELVEVAA